MENKIKTADEIVRALIDQGEPFYEDAEAGDELICALCSGHRGDRTLVAVLEEEEGDENGLSMMAHAEECAWRMAVDYVRASK